MKLTVKGRNVDVTTALHEYVDKRFSKLEKYFANELTGTVTLIVEKDSHIAEVTIPMHRYMLRAEDSSGDMYTSIDNVVEKIERQIRKYKTRINRRTKQTEISIADMLETSPAPAVEEHEESDKIVKVKRFPVRMMDPEEAIMQMELLDHDFFVFLNSESDKVDIVYRRKDGQYGLIQPESE